MPIPVENRRAELRGRIPGFQDAEIEFTGPDGIAQKQELIELSVSGASFLLEARIPGLEAETAIDGGLIRIGEIEIRVCLKVRHVTRRDGKGYECGVRLYPMSDQDRNELAALISRLRSLPA